MKVLLLNNKLTFYPMDLDYFPNFSNFLLAFEYFSITSFFKFWKYTNNVYWYHTSIYIISNCTTLCNNETCSDLFKYYDTIWYNSTNMSRLVQISWYLQTCPDMFKYYDTIWYDSTNMSSLVRILRHDLIRFYKHVQTCSNITTRFDTILLTCPDLFKY